MKFLAALIFAGVIGFSTFAQSASLEFDFGDTLDAVRNGGYEIVEKLELHSGVVVTATNDEMFHEEGEKVRLAFSHHYGLQKMIWYSPEAYFTDYRIEGAEYYQEYKDGLEEIYGKPTFEYEKPGSRLIRKSEKLKACRRDKKCGYYVSIWDLAGIKLALELTGFDNTHGYLTITYEGPRWSDEFPFPREISKRFGSGRR